MDSHHTRTLDTPRRSLEQYLAELMQRFQALPLDDEARPGLARRIREVEVEIDARSGLC